MHMSIKFDLDPTIPKVVIIAMLIFIEGFAIPAYTITYQGRMPEPVEWITFLFGAVIQVCTYLLTFLGYQKPQEEKT
jgi:phage shock protein PspC (stress-responsive transcriptional regulator)